MEVHITHVFQRQTSDPKIPSLRKQPSLLALEWMHSFARPLRLTTFLSLSSQLKHNRTCTIMPWDILISKKLFLEAMWKWDSFTRSKSLHLGHHVFIS